MRHVIYILLVANLAYFSWNILRDPPHERNRHLVRQMPANVRRLETVQERAAKSTTSTQSVRDSSSGTPQASAPQENTEARGNASPQENAAPHEYAAPQEDAVPREDTVPQKAAVPREDAGAKPDTAEIRRVGVLTAAEPPGAIATEAKCYTLGPFRDVEDREDVENRLNQLAFTPKERTGEGRVETGYWVYLPAMEYEEAVRITRMLDERNDRDYLIVKGNGISLGAYDSRERADLRMQALRKYGLDPIVGPLYSTRTAYWLDLDLPAGERAVLKTIRNEYHNVEVQESACR